MTQMAGVSPRIGTCHLVRSDGPDDQ